MADSGKKRGASRTSSTASAPPIAHALDALRRIVRGLRVASRQVESRAGVSAAQLYALEHVARAPSLSLRELADRLITDRTSAAYLVDRLETEGLVERRRSTIDRRRSEIAVTAKGRKLLAGAPTAPGVQLSDALERLAPGELASLTAGLEQLVQELGLAAQPARMLFADTAEGVRDPRGPSGPARQPGRRGRKSR
jgi:DNA-binding MarR family transcriptional regulator